MEHLINPLFILTSIILSILKVQGTLSKVPWWLVLLPALIGMGSMMFDFFDLVEPPRRKRLL